MESMYNDYMKTNNIKVLQKIKKQLHEFKLKKERINKRTK